MKYIVTISEISTKWIHKGGMQLACFKGGTKQIVEHKHVRCTHYDFIRPHYERKVHVTSHLVCIAISTLHHNLKMNEPEEIIHCSDMLWDINAIFEIKKRHLILTKKEFRMVELKVYLEIMTLIHYFLTLSIIRYAL